MSNDSDHVERKSVREEVRARMQAALDDLAARAQEREGWTPASPKQASRASTTA